MVKSKKDLYRKVLNEKTDVAWERYKEANKKARRVVREAKERDWIRWGEQLQRNFLENKRAFWKKVKAKGGVGVDVGIESKEGSMLSEKNEVKCRWREHFSELLGGEQVEEGIMGEELSGEKIEERSGMLQEEITKEEIRRGVGKLTKGKAGVRGSSGELLKAGGEVVIEWLFKIYNMVWRTGVAPEDGREPSLCPFTRRVVGGNVGIIGGSAS